MAVVVTGFGPFRDHTTNASWEAVRGLPDLWDEADPKLVVEEIPVEYSFVSTKVPDKWAAHNPILYVHVGVSSLATQITLEQKAHNSGYIGLDVAKCCPEDTVCVPGGGDEIHTSIDLGTVMAAVNIQSKEMELGVEVVLSEDAGRYLCDFVYYKSLNCSGGKSLFIHVPPVDKPYTALQMSKAIQLVLKTILYISK